MRYLFQPVLAKLEPFALDLWRHDLAKWMPTAWDGVASPGEVSLAGSTRCLSSNAERRSAAIDDVRALLEGGCDAAIGGLEHRAHQHFERAATKFVFGEEFDAATADRLIVKRPDVLECAERAVDIVDMDLVARSVERVPGGKALAQRRLGDFHIRDEGLDPSGLSVR